MGSVVSSSSSAIQSEHSTSDSAGNKVIISETGNIQGSHSGIALQGTRNTVQNAGHISSNNSSFDAVSIGGDLANVINTGTILSQNSAIQVNGIAAEVTNHGLAQGGNAVFLNGSGGSLKNYGTLVADNTTGVLVDGNTEIFNSGTISGGENAIRANSIANGDIALVNTGLLESRDPSVNATIRGSGGRESIDNEGQIVGGESLAGGDDEYRSMNGQFSGTMFTGFGDDLVVLGDGALQAVFDYDGGVGSDRLDLADFGHAIWVDLTYVGDEVWTRDGNTLAATAGDWRALATLEDVENIVGTVGNDMMRGDAADNTFT